MKVDIELWKKQRRIKQKEYYANIRKSVLLILGNKCIKCGFDDSRALQVDHVNGGGNLERKNLLGKSFHKTVLEKLAQGSDDYQLLCANCNWIKRFENNETSNKYK